MKPSVVLFPSSDMGHIIPMVELAKLFVAANISVAVIIVDTPHVNSNTMNSFISSLPTSYKDTIHFHHLPEITLPSTSPRHPFFAQLEILRLASPHLLSYLKKQIPISNIRALILDMFCTDSLGVADELGLLKYVFFSSGAAMLAAGLAMSHLQSKLEGSFRDLGDGKVEFPGLPPVPVLDLPLPVRDRGEMNDVMMGIYDRLWCPDGVIVNTFEWLERRAVRALSNDVIVPGRKNPPVYCVGPLTSGASGGHHACLDWLDAQPERSVVFLCFGSMDLLSHEQVKEIEAGAERSGQRFLFAVRDPMVTEGRKGMGMVVKSWVPQKEILKHPSVGAFVSHGGWNSTLEAVSAGVPMVVWPLYAEQGMNRVLLEEELRIAVGIEGYYNKGLVGAEEVERKIKWVMESEEAKEMKTRVAEAKMEAEAARTEEGSSMMAWKEIATLLLKEQNDR